MLNRFKNLKTEAKALIAFTALIQLHMYVIAGVIIFLLMETAFSTQEPEIYSLALKSIWVLVAICSISTIVLGYASKATLYSDVKQTGEENV